MNREVSQAGPGETAFVGNQLLATFNSEARALLEADGQVITLKPGDVVLTRGEQVHSSVFPIGDTMI